MKWELEDNTQEAIQFLALGAWIVLMVRALVGGIVLLLESGSVNELADATLPYRNSYLLANSQLVVIGGMNVFGRLAFALLISSLAAIGASLIATVVARAFGRNRLSFAVSVARVVLIFTAAIGIYSALFLPPRSASVGDNGITFSTRPALAGELSFPWPATEEFIPWEDVHGLEYRQIAIGGKACGVQEGIFVRSVKAERIFSQTVPEGNACEQEIAAATKASRRLIDAVTITYLDKSL